MDERMPNNDYADEHVRGSADGEISEDMYPRMVGESDEAYAKRLSDMREYMKMAQEDGDKVDAEKAAAEYAKSKIGRYEAHLRNKIASGVYTEEDVARMVANAKTKAAEREEDEEKYRKFQNGELTHDEFEGEHVRGSAEGEIGFDMYPRMKGETPQQYGERLKMMHEYSKMAREDGEKADAEKTAEEYASSKIGKLEAWLRSKVELGVYTDAEVDEIIARKKEQDSDGARYEKWLEERAQTEQELGETALEASEVEEGKEMEKSVEEMRRELLDLDAMKWLVEELNYDSAGQIADMNPEDLRKLYSQWVEAKDKKADDKETEKSPEEMRKELLGSLEAMEWLADEEGFGGSGHIDDLSPDELRALYGRWTEHKSKLEAEKEKPEEKKDPLIAVDIDRTYDAEVAAQDIAERMLREDLAEGKGLKKFIKGIWKGNMARGYYIEKNKRAAYQRILDKQSGKGNEVGDDWQSRSQATIDRFIAQYDEMIHGEAGEWKNVLPDNDPRAIKAKEAIALFAQGEMDEAAFMEEIGRVKAQLKDAKGNPKGEVVLDNYLEIARAAKGRFDHDEGIESIMEGFKLINGEARANVRTEAHRTALDKIVNKWEHTKFINLVPPELVAGVASVAYWMFQGGTKNAVNALTFGLGGAAVTGVFAGLKEGNKVSTDRAQAARESASGFVPDGTKEPEGSKKGETYHKRILETTYVLAKADDLTKKIGEAMESGDAARIIASLAGAEARTKLSDERKVDLIGYSDPTKIEDERFALDLARAKAKAKLRELGKMDEFESVAMAKMELENEKMMSARDRAFKSLRHARMLKQGAKTAVVAAGTMVLTQEVVAMFSPNSYGLTDAALDKLGVEGPLGLGVNNAEANNTMLAGLLGLKGPDVAMIAGSERVEVEAGSGRNLTDEQVAQLKEEGYIVNRVENTTFQNQEVEMTAQEYAENYGTRVARDDWGANGTTMSDGNELSAHYTANGDGIVTRMSGNSTTWGGETINVPEAMAEGKVTALVSLTGDTQTQALEITGRLVNGQMEFIPEPGSAAAQCFEDGKFIGKYFEVVFENGVDADGVQHVIPLATVVGKGVEDATFSAVTQVPVPEVTYNVLGFDRLTDAPQVVGDGKPNLAALLPFVRRQNLSTVRRGGGVPEQTGPTPPATPPEQGGGGSPEGGGREGQPEGGEQSGQNTPEAPENPQEPAAPEAPAETPNADENKPPETTPEAQPADTSTSPETQNATEQGDYDEDGKPIWKNMADRLGQGGLLIVQGFGDALRGDDHGWTDRYFQSWWDSQLDDTMRERFSGERADKLVPDSPKLREWLVRTGKMYRPEAFERAWNSYDDERKKSVVEEANKNKRDNTAFTRWLRNTGKAESEETAPTGEQTESNVEAA